MSIANVRKTDIVKRRLDLELVKRGLVASRSQAENWIRLGEVVVDQKTITKPGFAVHDNSVIKFNASEQYVSRAGLKLASVASLFGVDFAGKVVLDIGSSTGGFTDYALQHRTKKVFAVDVGTNQLHPSLRGDERVELYEKTDIRDVFCGSIAPLSAKSSETASRRVPSVQAAGKTRVADVSVDLSTRDSTVPRGSIVLLSRVPDVVVCDVSFISLREILPHVAKNLMGSQTQLLAMLKPQFEAGRGQVNKGIIKNNSIRRQILSEFEQWATRYFVIKDKRDSQVAGAKGNVERFYLLELAK